MATTYGSAAVDLTEKPWAFVAIPLGIVAGLCLVISLLHSRWRKRLAKLQPARTSPAARRAAERDLQEAWQRGAPGRPRLRARRMMRRWSTRGGGRWAWAHTLLSARGDEGLDEFGDAPPPYDGPRDEGKVAQESVAEDVEMQVRPEGSRAEMAAGAEGGSGRGARSGSVGSQGVGREDRRPASSELARTQTPAARASPPAYGEPPARDGAVALSAS